MHYEPAWMLNAQSTWAPGENKYLLGERPRVLSLPLTSLTLPLPPIGGPPSLGAPVTCRLSPGHVYPI